jgi:hypothetical protein
MKQKRGFELPLAHLSAGQRTHDFASSGRRCVIFHYKASAFATSSLGFLKFLAI